MHAQTVDTRPLFRGCGLGTRVGSVQFHILHILEGHSREHILNKGVKATAVWKWTRTVLFYCSPSPPWDTTILVIHNVQGCPRFARIAGCGTWHAGGTSITPTHKKIKHTPTKQNGYLLHSMCLEDQRLKQAYCDSDHFQVSPFRVL